MLPDSAPGAHSAQGPPGPPTSDLRSMDSQPAQIFHHGRRKFRTRTRIEVPFRRIRVPRFARAARGYPECPRMTKMQQSGRRGRQASAVPDTGTARRGEAGLIRHSGAATGDGERWQSQAATDARCASRQPWCPSHAVGRPPTAPRRIVLHQCPHVGRQPYPSGCGAG